MSINTPAALAESFKKTGDFERLRRDLLAQFQQDEAYSGLKSKIDEIVRQRFADSPMLLYLPPENAFDEVGKEVARNKLLGAATSEAKVLNDPTFLAALQASIKKVLDEEKQISKDSAVKGEEATADDSTHTSAPQDNPSMQVSSSDITATQGKDGADGSKPLVAESSSEIPAHHVQDTASAGDAQPSASTSDQSQINNAKRSENTSSVPNSNPGSFHASLPEPTPKVQPQDASSNDVVMADP